MEVEDRIRADIQYIEKEHGEEAAKKARGVCSELKDVIEKRGALNIPYMAVYAEKDTVKKVATSLPENFSNLRDMTEKLVYLFKHAESEQDRRDIAEIVGKYEGKTAYAILTDIATVTQNFTRYYEKTVYTGEMARMVLKYEGEVARYVADITVEKAGKNQRKLRRILKVMGEDRVVEAVSPYRGEMLELVVRKIMDAAEKGHRYVDEILAPA